MNIWLLKISEAWIEPGSKKRLFRVGMLAEALAARGHDVTWFNSIFDHVQKRNREVPGGVLKSSDRITIQGLRGCTYTKSRSFKRLRHHLETAADFRRLAEQRPAPDIVYCCWPTVDLAWEAVRYGRAHGVPTVIDIRDLWPEVVADVAPDAIRPLVRLILQPYYIAARQALRQSTVVIGITDGMLQWALDFAGRKRGEWDQVFPLGYLETQAAAENPAAEQYWAERDVRGGADQFVAYYSGLFPKRIDLQTVVTAARLLHERGERAFKFVLCGTGDLEPALRVQAAGLDNVVLTGWVEHRIIKALAPKCAVGLFPYPPRFDFIRNLPNKFFEYIGEGMPIVSCLEGEVQRQIEQNDCGVMYKVGDPQDLARVLCQVRDDPAWRASMAENARTLAKRFDATKVYADLVSHLETIAAAHRGAASEPAGVNTPGRSGAALASR